eukprot:10541408-Heterocapsa_arctica.AAC.1
MTSSLYVVCISPWPNRGLHDLEAEFPPHGAAEHPSPQPSRPVGVPDRGLPPHQVFSVDAGED